MWNHLSHCSYSLNGYTIGFDNDDNNDDDANNDDANNDDDDDDDDVVLCLDVAPALDTPS